jgi:hypothetical protein
MLRGALKNLHFLGEQANRTRYSAIVKEIFKGIVSRDEYFFLKAYNKKIDIFCTCTNIFTFFCFLVDKKIKLKV